MGCKFSSRFSSRDPPIKLIVVGPAESEGTKDRNLSARLLKTRHSGESNCSILPEGSFSPQRNEHLGSSSTAMDSPKVNALVKESTSEPVKSPAGTGKNSDTQERESSDDEVDASDDQATKPFVDIRKPKVRRPGISSEQMTKEDQEQWKPPSFPKTPEERASLMDMIRHSRDGKMHMLFGLVSNKTIEQVIDAFQSKQVSKGESVITQGGVGDFFYVVKSGFFEIFVTKEGADQPQKVWEAGQGFAFGELALLYNAPRTATITASEESSVWQLDRLSFRVLVVSAQERKWEEYSKFLKECDIFHSLNNRELQQLSELLHEEDFDVDEAIVEQGERDDKMFILQAGSAVACISGEKGEVEVKYYVRGAYFGEIALLQKEPRKASVYAREQCSCLYIDRESFRRVLGPIEDILRREAGKYAEYDVYLGKPGGAMTRKSLSEVEDDSGDDNSPKPKVRRKRCRELTSVTSTDNAMESGTWADKLAQDFARPALVRRSERFQLSALFHLVFLPQQTQQFTNVLPFHAVTSATSSVADDTTTYSFNSSGYGLKSPSVCSMSCQKGWKPGFEPTPNQDNLFVLTTTSGVDIYGVCDGHGPFGHLVSFRVAQSLPFYLTTNANFDHDKKLAVTEALAQAHADLYEFAKVEDLNFNASGTTCSILMLEGQRIHIATVGDSKIMVSSYNRHDSRLVYISEDHKPDIPEEKARIEATGVPPGEVRDGRIYIKGESYPGLTMSRAIGDFVCAERGVLQIPAYECITMQPGDEWYAVVASDGIWEFLDGETVTKLSAKKLRLKGTCETLRFLFAASRKRWKHMEDDYCDDVSGIIIQWNCKDKETSHCVRIGCTPRVDKA